MTWNDLHYDCSWTHSTLPLEDIPTYIVCPNSGFLFPLFGAMSAMFNTTCECGLSVKNHPNAIREHRKSQRHLDRLQPKGYRGLSIVPSGVASLLHTTAVGGGICGRYPPTPLDGYVNPLMPENR